MCPSWITLLLIVGGVSGLRWGEEVKGDQSHLHVCSGDNIHIEWNFTLSENERLKGMVWGRQPEGGKEEDVLATYEGDQFMPKSSFSGRLVHLKDAGIELSCATILESGEYTVSVGTENADNFLAVHRKTATVNVADIPKTQSGHIHVSQQQELVRDVTTGAWLVQLSCGNFSDRGHPPIDVIWTTPSGDSLKSTSYDDGFFHLLLPNPLKGGYYSCSLPSSQPAARCLPEDSPLLDTVSVELDQTAARVSFLEDDQKRLMEQVSAEMKELKEMVMAERKARKSNQQEVMNNLTAERDSWKAREQEMKEQMKTDQEELMEQMAAERDSWKAREQELKEQMKTDQQELMEQMAEKMTAERDSWKAREDELKEQMKTVEQELMEQMTTERDSWKAREQELKEQMKHGQQELMEKMTEQMNAERTSWRSAVGNMASRTEELEQWRATASPIAFTARASNVIYSSDNTSPLVLKDVLLNEGKGYSKTTGIFTAPLTGNYYFSAMAAPYEPQKNADLRLKLKRPSSSIYFLFSSFAFNDGHRQTGSLQGAVHLDVGDQVFLTAFSPNNARMWFMSPTAFSGFLLSAE